MKFKLLLLSILLLACVKIYYAQPALPNNGVFLIDGSIKWGAYSYDKQKVFYNGTIPNGLISLPQAIEENSYELIFEDEFNAFQLNQNKWNQPHEIQNHSDLHVVVDNKKGPAFIGWAAFLDNYEFTGNSVKLIAKELNPPQELKCIEYWKDDTLMGDGKPNKRLHKYSFGALETNYNYKYGYYEARVKLPEIENTWPSFWFFENTTEIDVFEVGRGGHILPKELYPQGITVQQASSKVNMTYHFWNHNFGTEISEKAELNLFTNSQKTIPYILNNSWHTWGLLWDDYKMVWFLDGNPLYKIYHYVVSPNNMVYIPINNAQQLQAAVQNYSAFLKVNWAYPSEQSKLIFGHNITNFSYYNQPENNGNLSTYNNINSDLALSIGSLPKSLEIDYVKIYALRNCNTDLNFCDGKDLPTHILGKTVTIGSPNYNQFPCNQIVKSKGGCFGEPLCSIKNDNALQYVHCVATNKISLKPGFKVEKGAYFHGRIENCNTANLRTGNNLPQGLQNIMNNQAYEDSLFYAQVNALNQIPEDSISNVILNQEWVVYPNPAKGVINIRCLEKPATVYKVQVSDMYGRIIYSKNIGIEEQNLSIDLTGNATGIYFLQLYNETKSTVKKIILK
ncbi:MAG: family 16 glycosylhydrolase [Flavobacteriales bacterium]|nr:family 16 glycosylhydrolase [Flavobacteriales bacterium]